MIRVALARPSAEFALGDTVAGEVHWQPGKPTRYRSVKVKLAWHTAGRGDEDGATVDALSFPGGETEGAEPLVVPFSLQLPGGGPMSYDGNLLRIIWTVHARADEAWKLGDDEVSQAIRVGPAPVAR